MFPDAYLLFWQMSWLIRILLSLVAYDAFALDSGERMANTSAWSGIPTPRAGGDSHSHQKTTTPIPATSELSWFNMLIPKPIILIPLTRFVGFVWIIAAGFKLPKTVRQTAPQPA